MQNSELERRNQVAQWAFDTRPILGRFHLWLEDVEMEWARGEPDRNINRCISFVEEGMERLLAMTAAVTALGTKLFGRYGEGSDVDKKELNRVKKDADAISAYAMSESLWYLSRQLPENHAIMVCLGEGLMPKAGETPEMGSNPMLGFGRIYARPQVAKFLEIRIHKLINDPAYDWDSFRQEMNANSITIWGTAIDTLENTSRFAKGNKTGPMTVLHVFNQPLSITKPYEGYIGNLVLPRKVVDEAADRSTLIDFFTRRDKVVEAIKISYPGIKSENIHVWTLAGKSREGRIGKLWEEWRAAGVHLVDDEWKMSKGDVVFTESGTYAPTYFIGSWEDEKGETHLFLVDGYAASAEAIQASSLCPILGLDSSLSIFSSKFELSYEREAKIMYLDPDSEDFPERLADIFGNDLDEDKIGRYRNDIRMARDAGIPLNKKTICVDDFLPEKKWRVMAISGYMLADPYTNTPGIEEVGDDKYRVAVRLSTELGDKRIILTLRLLEGFEESRLVFNPLLNRFMRGEEYQNRAVKISDSGRIRNELQTLCSEALEHFGTDGIRIFFDRISPNVISAEDQQTLRDILAWYKANHPIWFSWLEVV